MIQQGIWACPGVIRWRYPVKIAGGDMNSGFLCPECHQDLGSLAQLQNHYQPELQNSFLSKKYNFLCKNYKFTN